MIETQPELQSQNPASLAPIETPSAVALPVTPSIDIVADAAVLPTPDEASTTRSRRKRTLRPVDLSQCLCGESAVPSDGGSTSSLAQGRWL